MHRELVQDTLASLISVLAAIGAGWILCGMYALVSLHCGIALVKGGSAKEFFRGELINELLESLGGLVIKKFCLISTQSFAGTR